MLSQENNLLIIRQATLVDLDFLIKVDLKVDGASVENPAALNAVEAAEHRAKIARFVTEENHCAWVVDDTQTANRAGSIMVSFHDRLHEEHNAANEYLFRHIDDSFLPPDGRYCEIFSLWVAPAYRRQGLATRLKQQVETETRRRGISLIYTHTEERNTHVIEMNRKLGYSEIRRGLIGDPIIRVSLVKRL